MLSKMQKDGFETISHDFRNIFDNWLSHLSKEDINNDDISILDLLKNF